jgi:hypothetical protein
MSDSTPDADEARQRLYSVMQSDGPFAEKAERALEVGEAYLDVDNGHIARIDPDTNYWKAIASTDPDEGRFPAGMQLDYARTYCRHAVSDGGSIALEDAPERGLADDPAFEAHGIHCYHGTVITLDGEPYGTVCFVSVEPREEPFSASETTFAELVARMLEHELRRESLEAARERIEQSIDVMTHDLRNPLSVASGWIELERERRDSEHLDAAASALDRMEELIGGILSISRQAKAIEHTGVVSLSTLTDRCWRHARTDDAAYVLEGEYEFRADSRRVKQLFENLFRNAVEHGGTTVWVGALDGDDGFYVEDDGPGIDPEDRDRVFESGFTTGEDGIGLGLSIVAAVADAHGWNVSATDGREGGARFEIRCVVGDTRADA